MKIDIIAVTKKLIGEVKPIGESNADFERYNNLIYQMSIIEQLLQDVIAISKLDNNEYSIRKDAQRSKDWLEHIKSEYL